ncbi:sarcosine oxidase subunit gamma [Mycolicibacterium sp. P1-18]|uniref:sarcosine oxidase subunit gamma n=1 Tax=Mycolicibacterium sp. P1-18 TaxID=2024615 RepID=UPI0011F2A63C|nr:sarcosine oxidase subunit gamma family protein [Mycolicibacterium sp. P1-18]KAA0099504.1 sarcosine oxidase subunit gamma [Mycolicibacterium sp. P1-18]
MADSLTRHSPLEGFASRFADMPESAAVQEEPFVSMVDLWVDGSGAGADAAARVLGVPALPGVASTTATAGDTTAIWFGPAEWLVTSAAHAPEELESRLRGAVVEHGGAAVDVSAQRTTLRLRGAHARDVLAKGCSVDLHPRVFGAGAAVQTMLGQAAVVLMPLSDNGTDYRILVRSSFARYLAEWLVDGAEEFGVDWAS